MSDIPVPLASPHTAPNKMLNQKNENFMTKNMKNVDRLNTIKAAPIMRSFMDLTTREDTAVEKASVQVRRVRAQGARIVKPDPRTL